jgi:hypothetical protein
MINLSRATRNMLMKMETRSRARRRPVGYSCNVDARDTVLATASLFPWDSAVEMAMSLFDTWSTGAVLSVSSAAVLAPADFFPPKPKGMVTNVPCTGTCRDDCGSCLEYVLGSSWGKC